MANSLDYSANNTKLTAVATGGLHIMITAVTDSNVSYTEIYADGTEEIQTHDLSAGTTLYGLYKLITASTGYAKASR